MNCEIGKKKKQKSKIQQIKMLMTLSNVFCFIISYFCFVFVLKSAIEERKNKLLHKVTKLVRLPFGFVEIGKSPENYL